MKNNGLIEIGVIVVVLLIIGSVSGIFSISSDQNSVDADTYWGYTDNEYRYVRTEVPAGSYVENIYISGNVYAYTGCGRASAEVYMDNYFDLSVSSTDADDGISRSKSTTIEINQWIEENKTYELVLHAKTSWYDGCASDDDESEASGVMRVTYYTDQDGDKILDKNDDCPNKADMGYGIDDNGCPYLDTDEDGIFDRNDKCPETGDLGYGLKENGCPNRDSDTDGIIDDNDECPNTYGSKENGCPTIWEQITQFLTGINKYILNLIGL